MASPNSDPMYQGYVARYYTYYFHDSYFSKLGPTKTRITRLFLSIWISFTFLNLLIPLLSITRAKKLFQRLTKKALASKSRMYKATIMVITLFNLMYLLSTLIFHMQGLPNVLDCHLSTATHTCDIPSTATAYNYVIGILITKAIVLPIATVVELIAAVYIAKESFPKNRKIGARFFFILKTFAIWQLFVFAQIMFGLVSIPLIVLAFISPAYILLSGGGILLVPIVLIFVVTIIPLPTTCKFQPKRFVWSTLIAAETLLVAAVVLSATVSYHLIVTQGMNMSGVKVYIMSLIPTIPITIFVWIIKKKFFGLGVNKKHRERESSEALIKRSRSLPTEEEMIYLISSSDT